MAMSGQAADHANLAAVPPLIPADRPSFFRGALGYALYPPAQVALLRGSSRSRLGLVRRASECLTPIFFFFIAQHSIVLQAVCVS